MSITPGPWEIVQETNVMGPHERGGLRCVANCGGHSQNFDFEKSRLENLANALAISLVPEMLEVVREAAHCACTECLVGPDYCAKSSKAKAILSKLTPPGEGEVRLCEMCGSPDCDPGCGEQLYSLGFKEGVMWMDLLHSIVIAGDFDSEDEHQFFAEWFFSMVEGR